MGGTTTRRALLPKAASAALGVLMAATLTTAPAESAARIPDRFWGMVDPTLQLPEELPISSIHLGTEASWSRVERRPGEFEWDHADALVLAALERGLRPTIILGNTPSFHVADPGDAATDRTQMPKMRPWKRFVRKVTERYESKVDYQVWNEPNVDTFWTGTPDQMARVTRVAARIIERRAPQAKVLIGSLTGRLVSQRTWATRYVAALSRRGVWPHVDVIPLNPYPLSDQGPEEAAALVRTMRGLFAAAGIRKPLWVGEINYGVAGGGQPSSAKLSKRRQAAYVVRTYLLMADVGVRRVHWFKWEHFEDLGVQMTRPGGSATGAARALARARTWVGDTRFAGCRVAADAVRVCTARTADEVRRVYWRPTGAATIRTDRRTRWWEDMRGEVTERRGSFELTVDQAPVMVVSKR